MPINFIHCSDIHLGRTQYNLPERFDDFRRSFDHIAEYAIDKEVDFFLVSGDLFNKRNINAATLMQATSVLGKLKEANIPVITIEGNHDKAFRYDRMSWMHYLQENGYIALLKPQFDSGKIKLSEWNTETKTGMYIDLDQTRIYGLGYFGAYGGHYLKQVSKILPDTRGHFAILMFHSGWSKPKAVYSSVWETIDFQQLQEMSRPLVRLTLIGRVDFNVMSINPEVIRKRLEDECDCLFVEVINNINLITKADREDGYITRSDIERQVLNELINESVEFREQVQEMIELTMTVKSMALSRMESSEIVDFILNSVDRFYRKTP